MLFFVVIRIDFSYLRKIIKIYNRATEGLVQQQFGNMAGFGLNLKLVLYLQSLCLTESLGFLNPPLLQAAKRYSVIGASYVLFAQ